MHHTQFVVFFITIFHVSLSLCIFFGYLQEGNGGSDLRKKPKQALKASAMENLHSKHSWFEELPSVQSNDHQDLPHTFRASCTDCTAARAGTMWDKNTDEGRLGRICTDGGDLNKHAKSKSHIDSVSTRLSQGLMGRVQAGVVQRQQDHTRDVVFLMLVITLLMAQYSIPICQFPVLLAMQVYFRSPGHEGAKDRKYNHSRYFWGCLAAISEVLMVSQLARIKESPFFGISADTSSDVSTQDHMLLYITYFDRRTLKAVTEYLCCVHVAGKTGEKLYEAIISVLDSLGLDKKKFIAFVSDGDSAMTGEQNGVWAHLKRLGVKFFMHCAAHRCALVVKDVMSMSQFAAMFTQVDTILKGVHGIFKNSSKRWSSFVAWVSRHHGIHPLKFPVFNATRWFSRTQCLKVLTAQYGLVVTFLAVYKLDADLLASMRCVNTLVMMFYMYDIAHALNQLSVRCQARNNLPHKLVNDVENCKTVLNSLREKFVGSQAHASPSVTPLFSKQHAGSSLWRPKYGLKGLRIPLLSTYATSNLCNMATVLHRHLVDSLDERLLSGSAELMKAFRCLDPRTYRAVQRASDLAASKFCSIDFQILYEQVGKHVWTTEISYAEYKKQCVIVREKLFHFAHNTLFPFVDGENPEVDETFQNAWNVIFQECGSSIPHVQELVYVCLVIVSNTAEVERGFSLHRVYKTRLRSRILSVTLDMLLRLKLLGPKDFTQFDYSAARELYLQKKNEERVMTRLHLDVSHLAVPDLLVPEGDAFVDEMPDDFFVLSPSDVEDEEFEGTRDDDVREGDADWGENVLDTFSSSDEEEVEEMDDF